MGRKDMNADLVDVAAALAELFYGDESGETLEQTLDRLVSPDFVQRINGQVYDRVAYVPHVREMRHMVTGNGTLRVLEEVRQGSRIAGRYLFALDTSGGRVQFESHIFAEVDETHRITHLIEVARQTLAEDSSEMLAMTPAAGK
jgi:hypothetical protein